MTKIDIGAYLSRPLALSRAAVAAGLLLACCAAPAQDTPAPAPGANCVVTTQNRTAPLPADGHYVLDNLPGAGLVPFGIDAYAQPFRVRAVCDDGTLGETPMTFPEFGQSLVETGDIVWGRNTPKAERVLLQYPANTLQPGSGLAATLSGEFADGSRRDLTARSTGTGYRSSSTVYVGVGPDGRAYIQPLNQIGQLGGSFAAPSGVVITAENDGVVSSKLLQVRSGMQLSGIVYQPGRRAPAAGVRVRLAASERSQSNEVVTDAAGRYVFPDVPLGQYQGSVVAYDPGSRSFGREPYFVDGSAARTQDIELHGTGSVTVHVVDAGKQPVAGLALGVADAGNALEYELNGLQLAAAPTGVTDGNGRLTLTGVAAGYLPTLLLNVASQPAVPDRWSLPANGNVNFELELRPAAGGGNQTANATIGGTVSVAETRLPSAGVKVVLSDNQPLPLLRTFLTGANGKFLFDSLLPDTQYSLQLFKNGALVWSTSVRSPPNGQAMTLELGYVKGISIAGTVRDGGAPAPGTRVQLSVRSNDTWLVARSTVTDASAHYVFAPLSRSSSYRLDAYDSDGKVSSVILDGAATSADVAQDIDLSRAQQIATKASLSVTMPPLAQLAGNVQVYVSNSNCSTPCQLGTTVAGTPFVTATLPLGRNTFEVRYGSRSAGAVITVDQSTDGQTIELALALPASPLSYTGVQQFATERSLLSFSAQAGQRLNLAALGLAQPPVPAAYGVRLELYDPSGNLLTTGAAYGFGVSGQVPVPGGLQVAALPADGVYSVIVAPYNEQPAGLGAYWLDLQLDNDNAALLPLANGGTAAGVVYRRDGSTARSGMLVQLSTDVPLRVRQRMLSDADGHFRFEHLPLTPLQLQVLADEQSLATASLQLTTPAQVLAHDLVLPAETTLQLTVSLAASLPVPYEQSVDLSDELSQRTLRGFRFGSGRTSAVQTVKAYGDSITLSTQYALAPSYGVSVTQPGADGQTVAVDLLLRAAKVSGRVLRGGVPAAGMAVNVLRADSGEVLVSTSTDAQGAYSLGVPIGVDLVLAVRDPVTQRSVSLPLRAGSEQDLVLPDVVLSGTAAIAGAVRYSSGEPIARVAVQVSGTVGGQPYSSGGETDAAGQYAISGLPTGTPLQVAVTAGAFQQTQVQQVTLASAGQQLTLPDFTFSTGVQLTIDLLDGNRKPNPLLSLASIGECGRNRLRLTGSAGTTEVSAQNRVQIDNLPAGELLVQLFDGCAYEGDLPLGQASVVLGAAAQTSLQLVVPVLNATMRYDNGRLVRYPNARWTQTMPDGAVKTLHSLYGNNEQGEIPYGRFAIVGLDLGAYTLSSDLGEPGVSMTGTLDTVRNLKLDLLLPAPPYTNQDSDVEGHLSSGGVPLAGVEVRLQHEDGFGVSVTTNDAGLYQFVEVPIGHFTLSVDRDGHVDSSTGVAGLQPLVTLDLALQDLPYDGQASDVSGVVTLDGAAAAGLEVAVSNGAVTVTDEDGNYRVSGVPAGPFTVRVSSGWNTASASGLAGSAARLRLDLAIQSHPFDGSASLLRGVVSADGGVAPHARLRIERADDPSQVLSTDAGADGSYQFDRVPAGAFTLSAVWNGRSAALPGVAGSAEVLQLDLDLPQPGAGVPLSGAVRYSDGQPVDFPSVFVYQNGVTLYANSDSTGHYTLDGVQPGAFELTVQDGRLSGLARTVSGSADAAGAVTLDVSLPASGTVSGTVYDRANQPLAEAWIYLVSSGTSELTRYAQTDAQGRYRLEQVAAGSLQVGAQDNLTALAANGSAQLSDRQSITVDLHLPAAVGVVSGRVTGADGIAPAANAVVSLVTRRLYGPVGQVWLQATADANGAYRFDPVPAEPFQLSAADADHADLVGMVSGAVAAGASSQFDLRLGNAAPSSLALEGGDGYRYGLNCSGNLESVGPAGGEQLYLSDFHALDINGQSFPCVPAIMVSDDQRELAYGPAQFDTLQVSRRIYSPLAGGFLRLIDSFTNTSASAVTVQVRIGRYELGRNMPLLVSPASTAQRYAVLDQPPLAQVYGGAGVTGQSLVYQPPTPQNASSARLSYQRSLTIAPGATVSLMYFSAQAGTVEAVSAQGQALSNGAAAGQSDKLTPQDKAAILNFLLP
jgi:hypothetical protein